VEVTAGDGASVRLCAHGGHVLGWTPAGGQERLWLSRSTGCGPGTAVRGGVPVIWPQFAERGDGPRHGVARDRAWQVVHAATDAGGAATARLRLVSDGTDTPFRHPFTLHLDVAAAGDALSMTLEAVNDGQEPFAFTAALHTYLRVSSTGAVAVHGLDGLTAEPNDGSAGFLVDGPLRVVGPIDVAVDSAGAREVVLDDPVLGAVALTAGSFGSRVVWNPGPGAAPGDVHAGGEAEFVCLEPAQLEPVLLAPGDRWTGWQRLTATVPPG
jgi:glucose-6-phosphate 1-epimerase